MEFCGTDKLRRRNDAGRLIWAPKLIGGGVTGMNWQNNTVVSMDNRKGFRKMGNAHNS